MLGMEPVGEWMLEVSRGAVVVLVLEFVEVPFGTGSDCRGRGCGRVVVKEAAVGVAGCIGGTGGSARVLVSYTGGVGRGAVAGVELEGGRVSDKAGDIVVFGTRVLIIFFFG